MFFAQSDCTPLRKCSQQKRSGPGSTRRRSAEQPPPIKTNRNKADVPSTEDPQQSDSGLQTSDQAGNRATGAIPPGAGMTSKEAYHGRRATKRKEARKKGGRRGRKGTQPSCAAAHEVRVPHPGPLLHSMHLPRNPQKPTRPSRTSGRPSPTTTRRAKQYARADSTQPRAASLDYNNDPRERVVSPRVAFLRTPLCELTASSRKA
jgi:hypothetical protein